MRKEILANFPVILDPKAKDFGDKIRKLFYFLKPDIVEDMIINTTSRDEEEYDLPPVVLDDLFYWGNAKMRTIDFWESLYEALREMVEDDIPIPEKYLRTATQMETRTILL